MKWVKEGESERDRQTDRDGYSKQQPLLPFKQKILRRDGKNTQNGTKQIFMTQIITMV